MLQNSTAAYDLIRWEAERSYPNECCGILLGNIEGSLRTVSLTVTCENARRDLLESRYSIDPEKVIVALKLARSRAETIVGFYHSHPDQPPRYSGTDLAEAHWFDCSYVITSVESGRASGTASFVLQGTEQSKQFVSEEIDIVAYRGLPIAL